MQFGKVLVTSLAMMQPNTKYKVRIFHMSQLHILSLRSSNLFLHRHYNVRYSLPAQYCQ